MRGEEFSSGETARKCQDTPLFNVIYKAPHKEQPMDISRKEVPCPEPVPDEQGELLFMADSILKHRRRGRG